MTVAAKCNIVNLALEKLHKLQYGFSCKEHSCAVVENYLEYLNCPNITLVICNPADPCTSLLIVFRCNFNIISISATMNPISDPDSDIIFDLQVTNYKGGTPPFIYNWIYDEDDFDLISPDTTQEQIRLKLKGNKQLNLLVTEIEVEVTDVNGCTDSKSCWLTPEGLQCSVNFVPCNNPVNLEVTYNFVACSQPKNLQVSLT